MLPKPQAGLLSLSSWKLLLAPGACQIYTWLLNEMVGHGGQTSSVAAQPCLKALIKNDQIKKEENV